MADVTNHFVSDRHALYVGFVLGLALQRGLPVKPVLDREQNYTDSLLIDLGRVTITVVVPPPPASWRMQ